MTDGRHFENDYIYISDLNRPISMNFGVQMHSLIRRILTDFFFTIVGLIPISAVVKANAPHISYTFHPPVPPIPFSCLRMKNLPVVGVILVHETYKRY